MGQRSGMTPNTARLPASVSSDTQPVSDSNRLHGRRWAVGAVVVVVTILLAMFGASLWAEHKATERCLADPPGSNKPGTGRRIEATWMPLRYDCVYTDDRGNIVGRERVFG
jgi:hypothetical protein